MVVTEKEGIQIDEWAWGREQIIWGFDPLHQYTFKVLEPKRGRPGCLSLQYHHEKSETWLVLRGTAWALVTVNGMVCTQILREREGINLPAGCIHRLMGVSDDLQVLEPSTPDRHAADKTAPKDVVRLHCVHGRECSSPRNEEERDVVQECIRVTQEAIDALQEGSEIPEYHTDELRQHGGFFLS